MLSCPCVISLHLDCLNSFLVIYVTKYIQAFKADLTEFINGVSTIDVHVSIQYTKKHMKS